MSTPQVLQLSVLSQDDHGVVDGAYLDCVVFELFNGQLVNQSLPLHKAVHLPTPAQAPTPTPTWFFQPDAGCALADISFGVIVFSRRDLFRYPPQIIRVSGEMIAGYAKIPNPDRPNQIYRGGVYGIFGYAQNGPDGLIYTITAGVLNPREFGNK